MDQSPARRSRAAAFIRHGWFGLAFGAAVGLGSIPGARIVRGDIDQRLGLALVLFALGAAAGGFVASWLLSRRMRARRAEARFAAAIIALTFFTCFFCSFFLYLQYISYFAQYWADPFTVSWFGSVILTGGAVTFFFVTIALPMLLPIGLPILFGAAYALSRPPEAV